MLTYLWMTILWLLQCWPNMQSLSTISTYDIVTMYYYACSSKAFTHVYIATQSEQATMLKYK